MREERALEWRRVVDRHEGLWQQLRPVGDVLHRPAVSELDRRSSPARVVPRVRVDVFERYGMRSKQLECRRVSLQEQRSRAEGVDECRQSPRDTIAQAMQELKPWRVLKMSASAELRQLPGSRTEGEGTNTRSAWISRLALVYATFMAPLPSLRTSHRSP